MSHPTYIFLGRTRNQAISPPLSSLPTPDASPHESTIKVYFFWSKIAQSIAGVTRRCTGHGTTRHYTTINAWYVVTGDPPPRMDRRVTATVTIITTVAPSLLPVATKTNTWHTDYVRTGQQAGQPGSCKRSSRLRRAEARATVCAKYCGPRAAARRAVGGQHQPVPQSGDLYTYQRWWVCSGR